MDEARWRQLFGNSIVGISVIDSDFHFTDASPAFQKMVGYSVEELRRITPLDISIEEERELNKMLFLELRQGRRQNYQIVKRLRRKDGEVIWVSIYAFAVHGAYASEDMHIALVIDITENKKAEQALIAAQSELLRLSQLTTMGTMTASIAHEISQPLAAITTHGHAGLRWLSRVAPDIAEATVALRRIVENAERLSMIINGIRAMFKTDSAERTNIRVNDSLLEVLSFASTELYQSDVLVQSDLFPDLPTLRADRVQLQQVFFNLISNAIEAMRSISDRPRVLTIKSELNPADSVVITFADTGIGIEPKDLDRIFAPFVTTKASGMGMGLAICRSILEAHGGRIWVTAADPCGSVFHVRLPIKTPNR